MISVLSLAIRSSQTLGLHQLGTAQLDQEEWLANPLPTSDLKETVSAEILKRIPESSAVCGFNRLSKFLPLISSRSHLTRDAGRKLWSRFLAYDYYLALSNPRGAYQITEDFTGLPLILDEEEIPIDSALLPREKDPNTTPTDVFGYTVYDAIFKACKRLADMKKVQGGDSQVVLNEKDSVSPRRTCLEASGPASDPTFLLSFLADVSRYLQ